MSILSRGRRRFAGIERILIGADFFTEGGSWRSLHRYYAAGRSTGRNMLLIDRRSRRGLRQVLGALLFAPRKSIIVNSLNSLAHLDVLLLLALRSDAALYLHETGWTLHEFARKHPLRNRLLGRVFRRNPIFCVSEQAAALYRQCHGATQTHVVHECIAEARLPELEPAQVHIVMSGSLSRRKGVPLFTEVARLAATAGKPWHFHWIGGPPGGEVFDYRPEVIWWGWQDNPGALVRQARLFFLSSADDPQPLAAMEALSLGVPVVCYKDTGTAALVAGLAGCAVFDDHSATIALAAIEEALASEPDRDSLRKRATDAASLENFTRRLDQAIEQQQ